MKEDASDGNAYCADLVRRSDEDRWLAARYAGDDARAKLLALYAFQIELRRIPGAVSEPPLGEIRLQWWRDAFSEIRDGKKPRAHPVVMAISETALAAPEFRSLIDPVIDAAARPLYGEGFADIADLQAWLCAVDGGIDALGVTLLGGDEKTAEITRRAGAIFSLAREGRGIAPDLADKINDHATAEFADIRNDLCEMPAAVAPALLHCALTTHYAREKTGMVFPVRKRLGLFGAMAFGRF